MLQECWRPAFYRLCFNSVRQLQREADAWCHTYNHQHRNHGDYMNSRRRILTVRAIASRCPVCSHDENVFRPTLAKVASL